jgi:hypothetical protein
MRNRLLHEDHQLASGYVHLMSSSRTATAPQNLPSTTTGFRGDPFANAPVLSVSGLVLNRQSNVLPALYSTSPEFQSQPIGFPRGFHSVNIKTSFCANHDGVQVPDCRLLLLKRLSTKANMRNQHAHRAVPCADPLMTGSTVRNEMLREPPEPRRPTQSLLGSGKSSFSASTSVSTSISRQLGQVTPVDAIGTLSIISLHILSYCHFL